VPIALVDQAGSTTHLLIPAARCRGSRPPRTTYGIEVAAIRCQLG